MGITCLSRVPNSLIQEIANRLGVDPKEINPSKIRDKSGFDIVGLVQILNSQNQKSFDEFTEQDWNNFINEHIDEIMKHIDYSRKYSDVSIEFNLEHNGFSPNDYIAFLNDNKDLLNKVVDLSDKELKDRIDALSMHPMFKLFGNKLQQGFFNNKNLAYLSFPDLKKQIEDRNKRRFKILQTAKSLNISEEKKSEIYENYVKLMDRKREGKAIARDKFDFMFDNLQVYQNGDTYIFGEWDTKNNLFRGRLMSSPNIRQLYESLDILFGNVPFMASVPEDIGKMLRKKGLYELKVDKPYNFRGEDMIKHLYFSDEDLARKVFRKDISEITYEDVESYDRFYNQYKLIQQLKAQFFSGDYHGLTRTLIDLGIYDKNAYSYVKKLRNGELTEKEKHDIIQHIISNTKSNKVNIQSEDNINNDSVYEKLNTEVNKILVKYLSKFGFKTEITQDLEKLGIDGYSTIQILNKIAYINENKQENFPEEAGTVIAFMMQHNPLVTEIMKDMEIHSMFKKGISKEEKLQAVGDLIADELHKRTNEQTPESLRDKIKNLIRQFLDFLHNIRLRRVNRNIGYIVDNIIIQNEALITQSMYKPGAIGEPLTKVSLEKALKSDKFGSDVIEKLADYFVLTGSVSVAEQGTIYRPEKNLLHDIDWASPHSSEENKRIFEKVFPDSKYIRQISDEGKETVTDTWLIVPDGYKIDNLELEGDNNVIAYYDIVDKDGNIVNSYYNRKNSEGVRIENFTNDTVFGKTIDVFSNNYREPFMSKTLSGKPLRLSPWTDTFRAKLEYSRLKDIWDYNRFIPDENLQGDIFFGDEESELNDEISDNQEDNNVYHEYDRVPIGNTKDTRLQQLKDTSLRISDLADKSKNKNRLLNLLQSIGKYNSIIDLINSTSKSLKDRIADVEVVFDNVNQQRNKTLYGSYRGRRAYYDATDRKIHIDINAAYVDGDASSVIMHEIMHAVTLDLLKSNPEQAAKLRDIMKEYSEKVSSSRYDIEHGLEEFVADIWSNPKVIEQLKNTKADNSNMSLWDKIKQFFNNLFSGELFSDIKDDSLMAKASQELYQLLDMNADERQLGYYFENENLDANSISTQTADFGVELNKGGARRMQIEAKEWQKNNPDGIVAYRKYKDTPKTFTKETVDEGWIGNPFSTESKGKDTVQKFYDWIVTGESFGESRANEEYRQAVISKILSTPEDAKVFYYTELNRPSHATVIGYLIRNKQLLQQQSQLDSYESKMRNIINRFKKNVLRCYDFKNKHKYYVVVDENGRKFTKDDVSDTVVEFKAEDGTLHYGIEADESVSQLSGKGNYNSQNIAAPVLGTDFDTIWREYLKTGKIVSGTNFNSKILKNIIEDAERFKQALDEKFASVGGCRIITDEFPIASKIITVKGYKYLAGTTDMIVVAGDGSVYVFDMKTTAKQGLDVQDKIKYLRQLTMYKNILNTELKGTGMEVKGTGIILAKLKYPNNYEDYSISEKDGKKVLSISSDKEIKKLSDISDSRRFNYQLQLNSLGLPLNLESEQLDINESTLPWNYERIATYQELQKDQDFQEYSQTLESSVGGETESKVITDGDVEEDFEQEYQEYLEEKQDEINDDYRPVSHADVLKIGRAAVKFVTWIANRISKDTDGSFVSEWLDEEYSEADDQGNLPLYGLSISEILSKDDIYRQLFRKVIYAFNDNDDLVPGSAEYERKEWIKTNYKSILQNAFAELYGINGLKFDAHIHKLSFDETEFSDFEELYEQASGELEQDEIAYDIDKKTIAPEEYTPRALKQRLATMIIYKYDDQNNIVYDENGQPEYDFDENGMPRFLDYEYVSSVLFSNIAGMRSRSAMIEKMRKVSDRHNWMNQVISLVDVNSPEYNNEVASVFFKTFRKSQNNYTKIYDNEENTKYQKVTMKPLGFNEKSKLIVDNTQQFYESGGQSPLFKRDEKQKSIDVLSIDGSWKDQFGNRLKDFNKNKFNQSYAQELVYLLGIQIDNPDAITEDMLRKELSKKGGDTLGSRLYNKLNKIYDYIYRLDNITIGELTTQINDVANLLGFTMNDTADVSLRDNDKNYQRYSEPTFIQDVIEELNGTTEIEYDGSQVAPLTDPNSKYNRFRQFRRIKDGSSVFMNSFFMRMLKNPYTRKYLKHITHTSTNGEQYMKQGDKDYLLSLIKGFFATQEKNNLYGFQPEEKVAQFRVLMLSDKNSQEFVQFQAEGDPMIGYNQTQYDREFYDQFNSLSYEYFMYEIERMKSVLYHFRNKDGDTSRDIDNFDIKESKDTQFLREKSIRNVKVVGNDGKIKTIKAERYKEITRDDLIDKKTGKFKDWFIKSGLSFRFLSYLNDEIKNDTLFGKAVLTILNEDALVDIKTKDDTIVTPSERYDNAKRTVERAFNSVFKAHMEDQFRDFLKLVEQMFSEKELRQITQIFKNQTPEQIKRYLRWMFYNDNIAAMNIANMTIIDPAFNKDTIDFQKRYSEVHSQTQRLDKENTFSYKKGDQTITKKFSKDGKFRYVIINDQIVTSDLGQVVYKVFKDLYDKTDNAVQKARYKLLIDTLPDMFDKQKGDGVNVTDGQAYNSPTSLWKKMGMLGQLNPQFNEAYNKLRQGDFSISNINVVMQSLKPFTYGFSEQFDDTYLASNENTKLVPVQLKDSESLIILAGAILEGANVKTPLTAIFEFMEKSAFGNKEDVSQHILDNYTGMGVDTVLFKSVAKVGGSGVLDIAGKTYEEAKAILEQCFDGEGYNDKYVHELDFDAFGIQQNVPSHMQDNEQPLGSQERILALTDMPDDIQITVGGKNYGKQDIIREYGTLVKEDYGAGIFQLMKDFGAKKIGKEYVLNRSKFNIHLSKLLTDKIVGDSKYSNELYRAFSTLINTNANPENRKDNKFEFLVPIGDPTIANVVYSVLFTEIKKAVNEQNVQGGPVVQMTTFGTSRNLHITYNGGKRINIKNGKAVFDKNETIQDLIFEAYVTCPTKEFEQAITKEDGTLMSISEIEKAVEDGKISKEMYDAATNMIAYRIPTEDKYSIFRCKVRGFIPRQEGELVVLPKEITTLSGTDFDVDKLYCWFKKTSDQINKIKESNEQESIRYSKRNRMFDIQWEVLKDKSSVEKQLYPGGYDQLKQLAGFVNPDFKSGGQNIFMMQTQVALRKLNAAGKNFVGIAALNNVCHGMTSFCGITIKPDSIPDFKMQFEVQEYDGKSVKKKIKTVSSKDVKDNFVIDSIDSIFDGSRISRTLSMFVGAAADNAKEALLGALNITPTTANYAMTFIRMGIPIDMVVYMLNNPLIKTLSDAAENEGDRFETQITKSYIGFGINSIYTISEKELKQRINQYKNAEPGSIESDIQDIDLAVLKFFFDSTKICQDLSNINSYMSLNSMKNNIGPTITDAFKKRMQIEQLQKDILSGDSVFSSNTLNNIKQNVPYLEHLFECYTKVIDKLCETFSPVFNDEFERTISYLYEKGFRVDQKNMTNLVNGYLIFRAKQLGIFGKGDQNRVLLYDFPDNLQRKKDKYSQNEFVRRLYIENMKSKVLIPSVKYPNQGSTRGMSDDMAASWENLSNSNLGGRNLSTMLFEYMVTRFGFSWMPYSSASLTPMGVKSKIEDYKNIFDPQIKAFTSDGFEKYIFVEQFARNNPKCGLWRQSDIEFDENGEPLLSEENYIETQYGYASKYYKNLYMVKTNPSATGYTPEYIEENGVKKYRLVEVDRLGVDNNFMEYDPDNIELKTVIDKQYVLNKAMDEYENEESDNTSEEPDQFTKESETDNSDLFTDYGGQINRLSKVYDKLPINSRLHDLITKDLLNPSNYNDIMTKKSAQISHIDNVINLVGRSIYLNDKTKLQTIKELKEIKKDIC